MSQPPRAVIALDVGGTKIACSLVDETATIQHASLRVPTPPTGDGIVAAMIGLALGVQAKSAVPVDAIGIASAGVISSSGRVVAATSILRGWVGQELALALTDALKRPSVAINDVHAAALAEHAVGGARGADNALVVAVGTGVGGAIICGGGLLQGRTGVAGSLAHLPSGLSEGRVCACGGVDHLEPYASGPGIERTYRQGTGVTASLEVISAAARAGDTAAREAVVGGGWLLGRSLSGLVAVLDPDVVIVGGGVANAGDLYWSALEAGFRDSALPVVRDTPLRAATLGVDAPLVGAALAAVRHLDHDAAH